ARSGTARWSRPGRPLRTAPAAGTAGRRGAARTRPRPPGTGLLAGRAPPPRTRERGWPPAGTRGRPAAPRWRRPAPQSHRGGPERGLAVELRPQGRQPLLQVLVAPVDVVQVGDLRGALGRQP